MKRTAMAYQRTGSSRLGAAVLVALCLGSPTRLQAQERQAGIDFAADVPQGAYSQSIGRKSYGAGGYFAARIGSSPLLWGVESEILIYGAEHRKVLVSMRPAGWRAVDVNTHNYVVPVHFLLRAQPRTGTLRPYADGLIGFKKLGTRTTVKSDVVVDASSTILDDRTFSYGFGGGYQVQLTDKMLLDVKARYLRGGQVSYLKEGSIHEVRGQFRLDVLSSRTDVVAAQVGIAWSF